MQSLHILSISVDELEALIKKCLKSEFSTLQESFPLKEEKYLTRQETAAKLKISLPTLNTWTKRGLIKAYRISSRIRYSQSEVEDFVSKVHTHLYRK